jgi:hypothetical protein
MAGEKLGALVERLPAGEHELQPLLDELNDALAQDLVFAQNWGMKAFSLSLVARYAGGQDGSRLVPIARAFSERYDLDLTDEHVEVQMEQLLNHDNKIVLEGPLTVKALSVRIKEHIAYDFAGMFAKAGSGTKNFGWFGVSGVVSFTAFRSACQAFIETMLVHDRSAGEAALALDAALRKNPL